ncbi:Aspartate--tRNA ligase, cytoplasmic [Madurella mycetomatis]|uniref:Probable aspartate--tRNA ligase, cytoplasmic n=1 Tax=Madurella mycetomatis TaxID=100816 RepID=A0A175WGB8_9PEZI|nr:Aspartate--tRNA ligase, cytoplasmic [Madurella mycetomatis]KXX82726.1 Aspartate--tRNA ligase, cytoplasmic [Madurella mycetomatis]
MAPGGLKKPILALNRIIGHSSAKNHVLKPKIGNIAALDDTRHERQLKKAQEQLVKEDERESQRRSFQQRRKEEEERALEDDPPDIAARYGTRTGDVLTQTSSIQELASNPDNAGMSVSFTARVHHVRSLSSKLAFIIFREQIDLIQGVLGYREGEISENFVRWAEHLTTESFVHVRGRLQRPPEQIKGCSIRDLEVMIDSMHLVVPVKEHLPVDVFTIDQVEEDEETHQLEALASTRIRVSNRIAFLRTPTAQSIFRINSAICSIFRSVLEDNDFIEIHTPKLMPAATESGAEVFRVNYFGRTAFLAQSPQLSKQMSIAADFGRVFEIGPVFRAEDSNTHRHLTEYTGLDLEMTINSDYHEALRIIDELMKSIFKGVYSRCRKELDAIKTRFPHEDLVWLEETPVFTFKEAVDLLNSSGWTDDHGRKASELEDLSTRAEIELGKVIKEKYKTDYYIIDKFPASVRPFYTHLDPEDDRFTNSFDIFLRGQEITTGGQRIHSPELLIERMEKAGIEPTGMQEYLNGFEFGVLPHAGCGIGLERLLFLMLNLGDIRNASLFPRDPKSLPEQKETILRIPHPEADTIRYAYDFEHGYPNLELPPIEKLIANYGDATNTSWLDDRYKIWRHDATGAAVGYAEENGYALVMGNPLCDPRQYQPVIRAFLKHMRQQKDLRPIWLLVSSEVEEILASKLGWRTLSCVAEERVPIESAKKVAKKERQAEDAGVTIHELPVDQPVPDDLKKKCDERIAEWKANRKGSKQVHITDVRPWIDMEHRRYLWAETKEGEIAALCVLHKLSPANGYQIKFALDFPGSPSGTIEALISAAIQTLAKAGVQNVTFGAGALPEMVTGENMDGIRAKILSKTYRTIAQQLKLVQKSEFREKFGTNHDLVFICYPFMGLGVSGVRSLIRFFEDEM